MDLYQQLERIHAQCQVRQFSDQETMEVMRLCIYACLDQFPARTNNLPNKNQVLTSIRESQTELDQQIDKLLENASNSQKP